ncbi:MAG: class I poly(R)-hydroxyalkanoic acid synthase [Gammaproteobacteria bacterium]|nr:class I poly(R)-hydroxyalkanoic acid synthase [Gammaproteobacteria bacterium]
MPSAPASKPHTPFDPRQLAEAIGNIAGRSHALMENFLKAGPAMDAAALDPLGVGKAFLDLTAAMMANPQALVEAQMAAWNAYMNLWFGTANRLMGGSNGNGKPASGADRRFRHEAWESNPFFDFIRQSYLVAAETIQNTVAKAGGLDEKTTRKVHFFTKQFVDALSPTNFIMTNPEVLEATIQSSGENLLRGLRNFVEDFDVQKGRLRIRMTDDKAFELGRNVATSPGKVVFQNQLIQLIQYAPATAQVHRRPLLVMPPWINKYYVLDLQPKNSFIKWLVEQGHTVFVISWVNPDGTLADVDFQDYVFLGPLAALEAIEQATGEREVNVVGYCIGGTLLAGALAYMAAKGDTRIVSATFLTSLLDFSEPGDLGVFVDEGQLRSLESSMSERGFHEGAEMATTFNMLRSNDLIWSFFVNHYLLGKDPVPFDLLYWNSDSTRLPAKMHSTYLRAMYLENRFCKPGGMTIGDVAINLRDIRTPAYFLSTEEDHIAPWKSTFAGAKLLTGAVRFVLGKSGHIAGVVNPPAANKYGYFAGPEIGGAAGEWLARATRHDGSWWPDWQRWVAQYAGDDVPARRPGDGKLTVIEDAPGSYVKKRL